MEDAMKTVLEEVLGHYPVPVRKVSPVHDKGKKAVWLVRTGEGDAYLKKLSVRPPRAAFVAAATRHLRSRGAAVPDIIPAAGGRDWVEHGGFCYFLYRPVWGRKPRYNRRDMPSLMQSLGRFHRASVGFQPPDGAEHRSLLGAWPAIYRKKRQKMEQFKAAALKMSDGFSRAFVQHAGPFIDRMEDVAARLESSAYGDWCLRAAGDGTLCHQDYAAENLRIDGYGQVHVFDMDAVVCDLPARDLRKMFNKVMKRRTWELSRAVDMMRWYHRANPLTPQEWEVALLDMEFPHLLYGIADKRFTGRGAPGWTLETFRSRLLAVIRMETSKNGVLPEIRSRLAGLLGW
ncbi:MAG: CotS family spore coat protein [Firmicutes bacterium]|nr:CotS family spore coat protein [Bacillota bacterium]